MNKFKLLCESLATLKTTKILRYPKQIHLSEEFLKSLKKEIQRFQTLDESSEQPIRNFNEKFLKALHMQLHNMHVEGKYPTSSPALKKRKKGPMVQGQKEPSYGTSKVTAGLSR